MSSDKSGSLAFEYAMVDSGPVQHPGRQVAGGSPPAPVGEAPKVSKKALTVDELKAEIVAKTELLTAFREKRNGVRAEALLAKERIAKLEAARAPLLVDGDPEGLAANTTALDAAGRQFKDCDLQLAELHLRMRPLADGIFLAQGIIDQAAENEANRAQEPKLHEVVAARAAWERLSAEYMHLTAVSGDLAQRNQHRKQHLAQIREAEIARLIG